METKNQNYTVPIIMMILLFGMIAFVTNLAAPMGVVLKSQFGASNFQGMMGNAANFIAYAVMGIPGGLLLQRIGYKKTALIAIAVGFIGVGIQYFSGHASETSAFTVYLIGAFVAGFSMTLLNTVVNPMLNTLGGGGNKGNQLIQVGGSFNSVMATFTPAFVGILIGEQVAKARITDIFPVMYIALGIFALAFFVLMAVRIPEPNIDAASEPLKKLMAGAMKFRHFIFGALGIFVYVGIEVGVPGTLIFWLTDPTLGIDAGTAGSVAGTYWLLMLVGRLVGASIGSKVSSKAMLTVASFVGMVLVISAILLPTSNVVSMPVFQAQGTSMSFAFAQVPVNAMLLVLVGLCTSIMWGGIFNLAVEGLGKYVAAASGIFMTLVVGGGILPLIQNAVADGIGFQPSYWVPFLGLAYLFFYAIAGSKVHKRADGVSV